VNCGRVRSPAVEHDCRWYPSDGVVEWAHICSGGYGYVVLSCSRSYRSQLSCCAWGLPCGPVHVATLIGSVVHIVFTSMLAESSAFTSKSTSRLKLFTLTMG